MFADFHSLYQFLHDNGYYHTAIVFEKEHRLFGHPFSEPKEEINEPQDFSLCTSCRSNVESSKKSSVGSSVQEVLKHESTNAVTHRICKRCSHHTHIWDQHGSLWHQKRSSNMEKGSSPYKTGRCRSFRKGKNFKSLSFPLETTFQDAGKRLLERVNRWPCSSRDQKSSTLQTAIEQKASHSVSGENEMALLFQQGRVDMNSHTCKQWDKSDSFHSLHQSSCSVGPCSEKEHSQMESNMVDNHFQTISLLSDSPLDDSFMTFPLYDDSTSSVLEQSTDDIEANHFVKNFSNIFDDLFSLQADEKEKE
ncbi:uncharacterized protein Gasu_36370 [Galdieria sulphuraria]|uniref:Uncharacterized protein n=1 Tax=Galdieria sulphuraria TaxID=130081 RepID=M2XZ31_GALSU|nr:uncharacterized protein Gasu_36370 [Galdieria sulphuraria]EME28898.1 hypothetical protein Gasu_36370 [Galdieria sulphuraria]|eukprot:XP_005705418.1 hypothetical protein Gasu_36370 [Galdieria sulphuraria]